MTQSPQITAWSSTAAFFTGISAVFAVKTEDLTAYAAAGIAIVSLMIGFYYDQKRRSADLSRYNEMNEHRKKQWLEMFDFIQQQKMEKLKKGSLDDLIRESQEIDKQITEKIETTIEHIAAPTPLKK